MQISPTMTNKPNPSKLQKQRGMTLIETLVVLSIIALVMGVGVLALFPSDEAKLRSEAIKLASTFKMAYNEAAVKSRYFRLVFDIDQKKYWVESSEEPVLVSIETEENLKKKETPAPSPNLEEGKNVESTATSGAFQSPTEENRLFEAVSLPRGLKIKNIYALHSLNPKDSGQEYVYFLPNGWMEPVLVNLSDDSEEVFYSLVVNPLTAKTTIKAQYLEPTAEHLQQTAVP